MGRRSRALVMLVLCLMSAAMTTTVAAGQPSPPTVEDQNDRLLRHRRAEHAELPQKALELQRSMERNVVPTFEPGARTAWHTHPLGQTLIVTAGAGRAR